MKRRWALLRIILSGLLHGEYGPGAAWRMWRDADWTIPADEEDAWPTR